MADFDSYLHLLPMAIHWLLSVENNALENGRALTENEIKDAYSVGVKAPEKIRLLFVDELTVPEDPELRRAGDEIGLLDEATIGRTVRYGIEIKQGADSRWLLRHEFRHVYQFESADSFDAFILSYIKSFIDDGYVNSVYEQDARAFEKVE